MMRGGQNMIDLSGAQARGTGMLTAKDDSEIPGTVAYEAARADRFQSRHDKLIAALESIAGWQKVNISGEYEHGLRDIIRSITGCAAAALSTAK
jgi:hypothetical protein